MIIKIGTRGSQLALWQANYVAELLKKEDVLTEIVIIETKGDKMLSKPIAKIGSKGVFTGELEEQLRLKKIDIAVHSAKDLQSQLSEDLQIIAFGERENPRDVLVSFNKSARLSNFDDTYILGTSSTRRVALIKHFYPRIRTADVRGNLQTRFKKMEKGDFDALMLAYAGVVRLNLQQFIVEELPLHKFTPAVGQGSVAVECSVHLENSKKEIIRKAINHTETEVCILAERSFLRTLEGGCSIPVFGFAVIQDNQIHLQGGIISLDGKQILRENIASHLNEPEILGKQMAETLLKSGADVLLKEIKKHLKH